MVIVADEIKEILKVCFSERGSTAFQKEQAAYANFIQYMDECEAATHTLGVAECAADGMYV